HLLSASERAALGRWHGFDPAGGKRHRSGAAQGAQQEAAGREIAAEGGREPGGQACQVQRKQGRQRRERGKTRRQAPENEDQNRQIGRAQARRPQGGCAQKPSPAEVDETPLNPLITRIQVERSNDTRPWGTGRVSRYRLQPFSCGTIAGRYACAGNRSE